MTLGKQVFKRTGFIIILVTFFLFGCSKAVKQYTSGIYYGESQGYYSKLTVKVKVDDYNILAIEILEDEEPEILGDIVFEQLPKKIIKENNEDVDVISGATYTSKALIDAVHAALEIAREGIK